MKTENKDLNRRAEEAISGILFDEPTVFEKGAPGRVGVDIDADGLPPVDITETIPADYARGEIEEAPSLSEPELVRHYTRLSQHNFGIDSAFYPLGSCTMKYNPKINETLASGKVFASLHPEQPDFMARGTLELIDDLSRWLCALTGLDVCSTQPAAGAHGEMTALLMIAASLAKRGERRSKILLPDSSHGTNPASSAYPGYEAKTLPSGPDGRIDIDKLRAMTDSSVAALMVTNPNTLGLMETNLAEAARILHEAGGYLYLDGANLNAIVGRANLRAFGVDICHLNAHKTFSTPHGGGGPGAGPVLATKEFEPFLPTPVIARSKDGQPRLDYDRPDSIGAVHQHYGNVAVLARAAAYIMSMGADGFKEVSATAALNANYIKARLRGRYHLPYDQNALHEVIFSDKFQRAHGVSTLDIAKALIDRGFHPPTIYFPLIVKGAMMIEPTETETLDTLDRFVEAMLEIADLAERDPDQLKKAPLKASRERVDETRAAREPDLIYCCPAPTAPSDD